MAGRHEAVAIPFGMRGQRMHAFLVAAALFWLFAYAVLTVNATLDPTSSGRLFSEARLIATAAGTALLLGVLLFWEWTGALDLMVRLRMAALAIGAACTAMYAVRLFVAHQFGNYGATELADGGRWVIAWAGYFLATVSIWVAWRAMREADALRAQLGRAGRYECADDPFGLG
jgi:hypothetical protein